MPKIWDYAGKVMGSDLFMYTLSGAVIALATLGTGLQIYSTIRASNPNPPFYRDVNGDGVKDKIVQRKVEAQGILWGRYNTLEDEVLFGVEVNGKKLYLPKEDQFEEYQK